MLLVRPLLSLSEPAAGCITEPCTDSKPQRDCGMSSRSCMACRMVVEPLAANSLECMANGAATCFKAVTSVTLEDALRKDLSLLPDQFEGASWCSDYEFRCGAAARTWLRPHAQDNLS